MTHGPLYAMGGAHPNALQGLATGNRGGKPELREQQIHTPQCILDICIQMWGAIHLDPCASPALSTGAAKSYYTDGLTQPWNNYVYINPPYKNLKDWLSKSGAEYVKGVSEQILLFPARPNRKWWCEYMSEGTTSCVAWLKPLKFVGYKQAFPAPLVLVYTGKKIGDFAYYVKSLACHVGELG